MNKQIRFADVALSILFGLGVFLFFGYFYRYHLIYQEQFQLFLFTPGYLAETTGKPGGLAEYIGRFITQFYVNPWLGGAIIAVLLLIVQRQVLFISLKFGNKPTYLPITFIPSLFYFLLLCNEHIMPAGMVALVITLAAVQFYLTIQHTGFRMLYVLCMIPMLYGLAGGIVMIFIVLCIAVEIRKNEISRTQQLTFAGVCVLCSIFSVLFAKAWLVQYPLFRLWTGIGYYRFQMIFPFTLALLWIMVVLIPLVFWFLPEVKQLNKIFRLIGIQVVILIFVTSYGISMTADWKKEEIMQYDFFVRTQQWDKIIGMADRKPPMSPLSVSYLNLALCKEGLMAERMFHYFQNGPEGLLPTFVKDFTMPMMAGEVYYHLGFVNTAQRYAFEAMEAIPDYQKSSRAVKRLAETNLINGEYAAAKKYLNLLQRTLYYKKWADMVMDYLGDEDKIASVPEWTELRKYRTKTNFLFSEQEKDMMLGVLLQQDFTNRKAYEYLMAYCLLTKDLKHFASYYPLGKSIGYQHIPRSYQEALIYIWGLTNVDLSTIPYPISEEVKLQVKHYGKIYTANQHAEPLLKKDFSNTYWYYLHFRK